MTELTGSAAISAALVRDLRAQTGLGIMACKKALAANDGDLKRASEWLRIKGEEVAAKKSHHSTSEGAIAVAINGPIGALVELRSETDFVARNKEFRTFAERVAGALAGAEQDAPLAVADDAKLEAERKQIAVQLGENICFGKTASIKGLGQLYSYVHHDASLGVIADLSGGDPELGRDLCLHIAALNPSYVAAEDVPPERLTQEREIFSRQASESGKPAAIAAKMTEGRLRKFLAETTLLGQQFVKDPSITVAQLIKDRQATVHQFAVLSLSSESSGPN